MMTRILSHAERFCHSEPSRATVSLSVYRDSSRIAPPMFHSMNLGLRVEGLILCRPNLDHAIHWQHVREHIYH